MGLTKITAPRLAMAFSSLASLAGCAGEVSLGSQIPESCDLITPTVPSEEITIVTFWDAPTEDSALGVLEQKLRTLGGSLARVSRNGRTDLQLSLQNWFDGEGSIPDLYQVNGGSDVIQFAFDAPAPTTKICALDRLYDLYDLREKYLRYAWAPSMCRGSFYSIPLNIHRLNFMLVHRGLWRTVQELAQTQDEHIPDVGDLESAEQLVSILEWVGAQDLRVGEQPLVPLSMGYGPDQDPWPLEILAYENLLSSYPDSAYEKVLMRDTYASSEDDRERYIRDMAGHLERLGRVSNLQELLTWDDATDLVIEGRALLTVGGDWIGAEVQEEAADDIILSVFPSASSGRPTFVYTPDGFSVPRLQGIDGSAAHTWFQSVTDDRSTQLEFARRKHAIPVLRNLDADDLRTLDSDYLRANHQQLSDCAEGEEDCRVLLAVSGLAPAPGEDKCFDRMGHLFGQVAGVTLAPSPASDDSSGNVEPEMKACDHPLPDNAAEATDEMVELLLSVFAQPYTGPCQE